MTLAQRKNALFTDLINTIDQKFTGQESSIIPFQDWPIVSGLIVDGKSFTYNKHEYLLEPYKDMHPFQVEIKATQLGLTLKALLWVMYVARYGGERYKGIGYYFPSRTDVTDLSKARLTPLIEDNPEVIGAMMGEVDAANVKRVWNSSLYLRGMKSRVGMKSAPMDAVVFDELDEAPQNSIDMILERMGHSETGDQRYLSNPTLPDYGIDKLFQTTDQRFWLLKCPACNKYIDMVETFPDCLHTVKGRVIRACKCGRELDPAIGVWVAKRPQITERRGRQYSQLYSQSKTCAPELILNKFLTTNNLTDFYNLKIGIAYVDAQNRLSVQEVYDCCGSSGMLSSSDTGCFMGVDQGNKLHVVIGKKHPTRAGEIVYAGVHKGNNSRDGDDESGWFELDSLMKRFKVMRCVVDALPNTKFARNFAERFHGRVYLNYYNDHQKGHYKWNDKEMIVQANRTESLDASHNEISTQNVVIPRQSDTIEMFAKHLHNVAKKLEEDEETGSQRYVYVKLGEDHFRHAYNYECMARHDSPELMFPGLL